MGFMTSCSRSSPSTMVLVQPPGLDGNEQVAPLHEPMDDPESGEPRQGSGQRELGTMPALERDGEAHDEEDLPVDREDDDPIRLEQVRQPAHRPILRAGRIGVAVRRLLRSG